MTTTDLVYSQASLDQRKSYAQALSSAGELLPRSLWAQFRGEDGRTEQRPSPGKVLLVAETGNMLGIHPIAALNGVNVIEGKPTISPALMRGLVQSRGHKIRLRETGTIEAGDYAVTAELVRADDPENPYTSTWTPHRAARAGLCKYALDQQSKVWKVTARSSGGKVLPWEAYTESLCIARASGDAIRAGAADVLMGVQYTPEELGGSVNEAGELVDVTATAVDRTPPPHQASREPEPEPVEAEVVEEQPAETPAEPEPTAPVYIAEEADEWAAQVSGVPEIGNVNTPHALESDTLYGVYLRAQKAGVLDHLVDDPTRVEQPITIERLIEQRREELQAKR